MSTVASTTDGSHGPSAATSFTSVVRRPAAARVARVASSHSTPMLSTPSSFMIVAAMSRPPGPAKRSTIPNFAGGSEGGGVGHGG